MKASISTTADEAAGNAVANLVCRFKDGKGKVVAIPQQPKYADEIAVPNAVVVTVWNTPPFRSKGNYTGH